MLPELARLNYAYEEICIQQYALPQNPAVNKLALLVSLFQRLQTEGEKTGFSLKIVKQIF